MLIRAVIVTLCLVGTAGAINQARTTEAVTLRRPLGELSMSLGGWTGQPTEPFDARTMRLLGVDEYVSRYYYAPDRSVVSLYVGYYSNQRQGDTMHSPLNCLPGSGWQPMERGRSVLTVADTPGGPARPLEVNRLVIQNGPDRQVALYWYHNHGRTTPSEYWSKFLTVAGAIRYNRTDAAMVRVIAPITTTREAAELKAAEFAAALFPQLHAHFPL